MNMLVPISNLLHCKEEERRRGTGEVIPNRNNQRFIIIIEEEGVPTAQSELSDAILTVMASSHGDSGLCCFVKSSEFCTTEE